MHSSNSLIFQDIIGKTDVETSKQIIHWLFTGAGAGAGVKESQDFKTEVLEQGVPAKREITFETELFGSKTFLIYVEPVFSNAGDTIGVNYMWMDVTDQVSSFTRFNSLYSAMVVFNIKFNTI